MPRHDDARAAVPDGVCEVRWADDQHRVLTTAGGRAGYRRRPCGAAESTGERPGCPWRVDAAGHFPPQAFALSARTAYDAAGTTFGCHESPVPKDAAVCAGFLLRGAVDNLAARMLVRTGRVDVDQVDDGGYELHDGYWSMAVANGVDPEAVELAAVRLSPWEEAAGWSRGGPCGEGPVERGGSS